MPKTAPFDKYSDEYESWFERNQDLYGAELKAIQQLFPSGEITGLEVGVGSGKFAVPLGIQNGIEPSENMLCKARKLGINVVNGVAEDLPFPNNSFDLVLMVTTLCFLDDANRSLEEVYRVLKAKGLFIVGFIDKESPLGKEYQAKKDSSKFYKDASFFSSNEVLKCLEHSGFNVEKVRQTLIEGEEVSTILSGYGRGAFVVIRAAKLG